jgi:riboflavin synthase
MFTGLVEAVGALAERTPARAGCRLRIDAPLARALSLGDSIAVNGVCLTVTSIGETEFAADVSPETARVSTLGTLPEGALVNLERPVRAGSPFGGHFVLGHVDAVGSVLELRPDEDFRWLSVRFPTDLGPYIVVKGSIAIDGISLTVAALGPDCVSVQIVPYTMQQTNLRGVRLHDRVNLECDIVGKYVVRAAEVSGMVRPGRREPVRS